LLQLRVVKLSILLVLVAACAADPADIESRVTISQGAYGLVGAGVGVTVELPPAPGSVHGASLDAASADPDGVYQFELEPGTYQLCTEACTLIDVPDEARVRHDWISGPGGGSWCDGSC
jgi:hypothetical protein